MSTQTLLKLVLRYNTVMKNLEHPENEPIDITGEVVPKEVFWQQKLVDDGLAYWEDGELMMKLPLYGVLRSTEEWLND